MKIMYDNKTDLLYLRLDERKQGVINKRISDEIVIDIGRGDKIVGLEIQNASKRLRLKDILPVTTEISSKLS